jgi:hypothetical protein
VLAIDGDGTEIGVACAIEAAGNGSGSGSGSGTSSGGDQLHAYEPGGASTSAALTADLATSGPLTLIAWRSIDALHNTGKLTCLVKGDMPDQKIEIPTIDTDVIGNHAVMADGVHAAATSVIVYTSPGLPSKNPPP